MNFMLNIHAHLAALLFAYDYQLKKFPIWYSES